MSRAGTAANYEPQAVQPHGAVDREELGEVLGLVQEGMLKVVRFQLAMERRDRRVAMEAIDDVVHLERKIADYVVASAGGSNAVRQDVSLQKQRAALAQEKFMLAAGVSAGATRVVEQDRAPAAPVAFAADIKTGIDAMEPAPLADELPLSEDANRARGSITARLICALVAILLVATALAATLLDPALIQEMVPPGLIMGDAW